MSTTRRGRRGTRATIAALTAAACLSCSAPSTSPTGAPSAAPRPAPSAPAASTPPTVSVAPATPITPGAAPGQVQQPTGVPPVSPAPTNTAIYGSPQEVARAWMQQFCQTDYRDPINAHLGRAAAFQTPAGVAADQSAGDTPATYQRMVEEQLTNRCDQITAEISQEAPAGPNQVYVVTTARRTQLAADRPFQTVTVASTRSVLRQPDDRWLVDVQVVAG